MRVQLFATAMLSLSAYQCAPIIGGDLLSNVQNLAGGVTGGALKPNGGGMGVPGDITGVADKVLGNFQSYLSHGGANSLQQLLGGQQGMYAWGGLLSGLSNLLTQQGTGAASPQGLLNGLTQQGPAASAGTSANSKSPSTPAQTAYAAQSA
ncbi:hypothetical protein MP228_006051 [Amoeboaphelidium protococcarum]|nr:hypothetical protein MP228_006051 [Amoeboaphelidium protococcarum]